MACRDQRPKDGKWGDRQELDGRERCEDRGRDSLSWLLHIILGWSSQQAHVLVHAAALHPHTGAPTQAETH